MAVVIRFRASYLNCVSALADDMASTEGRGLYRDTKVLHERLMAAKRTLHNYAIFEPFADLLPDEVRLAASDVDGEVEDFRSRVRARLFVSSERAVNAAQRLFENLHDIRRFDGNPSIGIRDPDSRLFEWRYDDSHILGVYLHPLAQPELLFLWAGSNAAHEDEIGRILGLDPADPGWDAISPNYAAFLRGDP